MKILALGISMFVTGFIGFAVLCAATMTSNFTLNASTHYIDIWRLFGITPIVSAFLLLGISGFLISMIGLFHKKK